MGGGKGAVIPTGIEGFTQAFGPQDGSSELDDIFGERLRALAEQQQTRMPREIDYYGTVDGDTFLDQIINTRREEDDEAREG